MSLEHQLRQLRPGFLRYALELLEQARTGYSITSVWRSPALQARLYRRFLAGLHPYPVAPPGRSKHEQGLAWDMTAPAGELRRLGLLWERMGGRWGGRFRDPIHFEAGPRMVTASYVAPGRARRGGGRTASSPRARRKL